MLYQKYKDLFKKKEIKTGFSYRLYDYSIKYWINQLEKALKDSNYNNFLDIGAGQGRLTILLANSNFKKGTAIEVKVEKKIWNTILNKYKIILEEGLLEEKLQLIENKKEKFDFIILAEVFEHIPLYKVNIFLKKIYTILANNGKIFLTTPNRIVQGPAEKSFRWYKIQEYGHHKHYSYNELKNLFSKHKFKIKWHKFESNKIKKNLYNKLFYSFARLDLKLLNSKKLPNIIRKAYKVFSTPFMIIPQTFFFLLSQLIFFIEKNFNNENNSETIILFIEKQN